MKIILQFSIFFFFVTNHFAQDTTKHDPLVARSGSYPVFANSAELVHITTSYGSPFILHHDLHDFLPDGTMGGPGTGGNDDQLELSPERRMDYVAADVNGDGKDKLFISRIGPSNTIEISVSTPIKQTGLYWNWGPTFVQEFPEDTAVGPILLIAANVDSIPGKELIECFKYTDGYFSHRLKIYCYNSFDNVTQMPNNKQLIWYSHGSNIVDWYDISAGDIDDDGLDEILVVSFFHYINEPTQEYLSISAFKYNPDGNNWVSWGWDQQLLGNINDFNFKGIKIAAGDFRNKGFDEAVISITEANGNNGGHSYAYVSIDPEQQTMLVHYGGVMTWGLGWNNSVVAKDLNPLKGDGDELVVAGAGELAILKFNELLNPHYLFSTPTNQWDFIPYERRKFLAVTDVNADTAETSWTQEVVLANQNWSYTDSITIFRVFEVNLSDSNTITGLNEKYNASGGSPSSAFSEIVMGDFDGDAVRLGPPTLLTKEYVYQPIVQLNVPPTHFDYLNGEVYDICQVYSSTTDTFKVTYRETQGATTHFSSESSESWGVSAGLSAQGSLFGVKVKAYVKGSYDKGYYGSRSVDTIVTTSQQISTWGDDFLLATVTDYDFWEYPVMAMGKQMGNALIMIPHHRSPAWFSGRDIIARNWIADHEVGNLFSYPSEEGILNWVGSERLLTTFTGQNVVPSSQGIWWFNLFEQSIDESKLTSAIGAEVGLSVKKWGIEAKVSGRYSNKEITTHTSTASRQVAIKVIAGAIDQAFSTAIYKITPYIYWGENGAMVIDYAVDPSSAGDTLLGTFWDEHYFAHSDPGFILPWRLDSFKGIGGTSNLKFYNKSLHVSPIAPAAGDTAYITANIHNFSLKETAGTVKVRFYVGDPANGGTPIIGVGGITELTTDGPILSQNRKTVDMEWVVPSGLDNTARVYAVIDPDNTITEVHEDNNKGFVPLMVSGATFVEEEMKHTLPHSYSLEQNYPNPFNPSTKIKYSLPQSSNVIIKVFDILGNEIETLVSEEKPVGTYEINWNAANLPSGVYFYQFRTGSFVETKKMILLK